MKNKHFSNQFVNRENIFVTEKSCGARVARAAKRALRLVSGSTASAHVHSREKYYFLPQKIYNNKLNAK